jgi:DNA-binding NarL/FixJ family response regulator
MTRVLVIADRPSAAQLIASSFDGDAHLHVVARVDGGSPCADAIRLALADVILVDEMSAPGRTAARVREARLSSPKAKVVVLAGRMQPSILAEVTDAGAHGAIDKGLGQRAIAAVAQAIVAGSIYHAFDDRRAPADAPRHSDLTKRELEILSFVAEGASNARIARSLWVTEQTIKFHLSNVYRKLGVTNRTQASHYAHVHGLVNDGQGGAPATLAQAA